MLGDFPLDHEVIFASCCLYTKGSWELLHDYNWLRLRLDDWFDWLDWLDWLNLLDWLNWFDRLSNDWNFGQ